MYDKSKKRLVITDEDVNRGILDALTQSTTKPKKPVKRFKEGEGIEEVVDDSALED
jgi:hypothetical protein